MRKRCTVEHLFVAAVAVCLASLALASSVLFSANAASSEYPQLQISWVGDRMYPAIADGDTVTLEFFTDAKSVKVGDIIVYDSIVAVAWFPGSKDVWIIDRVVEIFEKDGHLWFKTKGDHNVDVDPWDVPDHRALGKAVGIVHSAHPSLGATVLQPAAKPVLDFSDERVQTLLPLLAGSCITAVYFVAVGVRKSGKFSLRRSRWENCRSCRYYQTWLGYELIEVKGRLEMRRTVDWSRGFCEKKHAIVFEGVGKGRCRKHRPIEVMSSSDIVESGSR
jgi:signal peptidase I